MPPAGEEPALVRLYSNKKEREAFENFAGLQSAVSTHAKALTHHAGHNGLHRLLVLRIDAGQQALCRSEVISDPEAPLYCCRSLCHPQNH